MNSRDKFQICRNVFDKISSKLQGILHVFMNFAGFHGFTRILWLCDPQGGGAAIYVLYRYVPL